MGPEVALFQAFVLPAKRQRYVELVATKRGREKILSSLDHFKDLDPRVCRKLNSGEQSTAAILQVLESLGAPSTCHVMSPDGELDGQDLDLQLALSKVVGGGQGTFISCLPGELAYFESEEPRDRYLCHRKT
jgi:hypothetical protein